MKRAWTLLTTLAVCATLASLPARADDASALLAKHAAFVGWQIGDPTMTTLRMSGTRSGRNVTDKFSEIRQGLVFRDTLTSDNGQITRDNGFTGRVVWHANDNGNVASDLGATAFTMIDLDVLFAEAAGKVQNPTVVGQGDAGGVHASIVRVTPPGGLPMDLYVDPNTGAFARAVIDPTGANRTVVDIEKYTDAGSGKKVIGAYRIGDREFTVSQVTPGGTVTPADLEPPQPRASWTFGSTDPVGLQVQEDQVGRHIFVHANVNGHDGLFLLDSSAPAIVVFDDFAGRVGLRNIGTSDFSPIGTNPYYDGMCIADSLGLGQNVLHNVAVERVRNISSQHFDGFLGYDFFAQSLVNIDLKKQTIQLLDPAKYQPTVEKGAYAFQTDLTDQTPHIVATLPSGATAHPMIDTSLNAFAFLSLDLRDSGKIKASDATNDAQIQPQGVSGGLGSLNASNSRRVPYYSWTGEETEESCLIISSLLIGPYKYDQPPLCLGARNVFGSDGGAIGMNFLTHFDWTFDYPDHQIVLTPNGT